MDAFRKDTLEVLHKSGDEPEATELLSYASCVELAFMAAETMRVASVSYNRHAPSVRRLAEVFAKYAPLDQEIDADQVCAAAIEVPIAPLAALKATLRTDRFTFQDFAERIYGSPTVVGWWPGLMEDAVVLLDTFAELPGLPCLRSLVAIFECAAGGKSYVGGASAMLEKVLVSAGLPTEGYVVEAELSALGTAELGFQDFVEWLGQLCLKLREVECEGVHC